MEQPDALDEWRKQIYALQQPEPIPKATLVINGVECRVTNMRVGWDDVEFEGTEIGQCTITFDEEVDN